VTTPEASATAEAVARRSYGKLVAILAARTRDVAGAEDALADAFAAALAHWPQRGVPANPEGWLLTAARRRLIDVARQRQVGEAAATELQLLADQYATDGAAPTLADERLELMFACAHPAIDVAVRAPLILQAVLGFDAATVASAFLVAPATMGQRLVRAKTRIREAGIPFRIPDHEDLPQRLPAVLDAIYAAFTEGWSDPLGADARRRNLADEGIWLGRLVASLLPDEPEALGLLALMLHADARREARRDDRGDFVPLAEQDPARWNAQAIDAAEALLRHASTFNRIGRYQLEAAIQSAHVVRRVSGRPDWAALETLYDALAALSGSPVVAINRAIVVAERRGAAAGLAAMDAVATDPRLADYQPYWAARAELLARAGDLRAADEAYQRAIGLESDPSLRAHLQKRKSAARVTSGAASSTR
jgi:RNA polymerase sigma-70 factor (ECF subfamily)